MDMKNGGVVMAQSEYNYRERKAERKAYFNKYSGKKLITCIACNGSGRYDHNGSPSCGACQGTGKVRKE